MCCCCLVYCSSFVCYTDAVMLYIFYVFILNRSGIPSARVVLLKGFDKRGFMFYTNYQSRKGKELVSSNAVTICLYDNYNETRDLICQYLCRMRQSCTGNLKIDIASYLRGVTGLKLPTKIISTSDINREQG